MLGVDRAAYRAWFSSDVFQDFGHELSALLDAGLLTEQGERLSLTPEGMFYGDTVAGTLAWRRVQTMRAFDALAPRSTRAREELLTYDSEFDASLWDPMG
jgi:hypothetical protein